MAELYNFFGDIFDYIRETYLEVDFGSYKNFTVNTQGVTLSQIIIGILFGCMLASFAVVYQRTYLGRMVRGLLSREAHDEESALNLKELGLDRSGLIKYTLRSRSTPLRKVVRFVGEEREEEAYDGTRVSRNAKKSPQMTDIIDYENARFYIPKHLAAHAEVRFDKKGSGARALIISALACVVAAVVLIRFLPVLLHWADDLITFLS
jgi:hypothetical protein